MLSNSPNGKSNATTISVTGKRAFEPSTIFDDFDSENIDPSAFESPSKKTKNNNYAFDSPVKPFAFALSSPVKPSTMAPPSRMNTSSKMTPMRSNLSSPRRTPMTAPAGRSPPRKTASGGIFKNRRTSAPFGRIDPPSFASAKSSSGNGLPFSLDAALSGTFSTSSAPKTASSAPGTTLQDAMPTNWFFDIYEDTADETAHNLLEHSTLTLDLSSDEESSKAERNDRGKENTPPEGYDGPTASRPAGEAAAVAAGSTKAKKMDLIRKRILASPDEMDDGLRSPLSDLETDPFIPAGLDKSSHVLVVDGVAPATATTTSVEPPSTMPKFDVADLFGAAAVPFGSSSSSSSSPAAASSETKIDDAAAATLYDVPVVNAEGEVKGDIIVFEDAAADAAASSSPCPAAAAADLEIPTVVVDAPTPVAEVVEEDEIPA